MDEDQTSEAEIRALIRQLSSDIGAAHKAGMAHHNVHAGPHGAYFRLSNPNRPNQSFAVPGSLAPNRDAYSISRDGP
jgi:hypothetical protein